MSFWSSIRSILPFLGPVAGAYGGSALGEALGGGAAGAQSIGGALGGAAGGALGAAADKRNPVTGAVLGGVGGAIYPNIGDIISSVTGSGAPATGVPSAAQNVANTATAAPAISGPVATAASAAAPSAVSAAGPAAAIGANENFDLDQLLRQQYETMYPEVRAAGSVVAPSVSPPLYNGTGVLPIPGVPGTGGGSAPAAQPSLVQQAAKFLGFDSAGAALGKVALPAASIAYSAMQSDKPIPHADQLENSANQMSALAQRNLAGEIPQAQTIDLQRQANSQKAEIRSRYAQMGMSGSTSEASALRGVDQRLQAQREQISQDLMRTGLQQAGAANNVYTALANQQLAQDRELSDAIAAAAAAAASPAIQLKVA